LESKIPQQHAEYLKMIKVATQSGSNLIKDLLDVNAIEANAGGYIISDLNVGKLLEDRVNSFQVAADLKSIQLIVRNDLPSSFKSDADYLNRIIDNLVSNAIKFSPKNSIITINGRSENDGIFFSIKDLGPGFSESDKSSLFQKFKRLSAQPTGGESSNGLGLAIVKTLVDRLGGEIILSSESGAGAEFILRIPEKKI
jgi:signal transduction histidine kinase